MITIGKTIYTILSTAPAVTALVGTKIYPLVIPENGTLPCVIYERSYTNNYVKEGISTTDSNIDITVLAEDYAAAIDISTAVFNALNMYEGIANGTRIYVIKLVNGGEAYGEGAYFQKLSFEVKSSQV